MGPEHVVAALEVLPDRAELGERVLRGVGQLGGVVRRVEVHAEVDRPPGRAAGRGVLLVRQRRVLLALAVAAGGVLAVKLEHRHQTDARRGHARGLRAGQQFPAGAGIDNGKVPAHRHGAEVVDLRRGEPGI